MAWIAATISILRVVYGLFSGRSLVASSFLLTLALIPLGLMTDRYFGKRLNAPSENEWTSIS